MTSPLTIPSKTFPLGAGNKVYAGKARPGGGGGTGTGTFNLVAGQAKSIHLNSLSSVDPDPNKQMWYAGSCGINGPWANWNGGVFSPDSSALGSMNYFGGGHLGYDGTEIISFDLSTQRWSIIGTPAPTDFLPNTDYYWCDVPYMGGYVIPASHTYFHATYVGPTQGGGPKGGWLQMFNVYGGGPGEGQGGNINGYEPHVCPLDTGLWDRFTSNGAQYVHDSDTANSQRPTSNYGNNFVDKHNILWSLSRGGTSGHFKVDLNQPTKTMQFFWGPFTPGWYWPGVYIPEQDFLITSYVGYMADGTPRQSSLVIYDLTTTGNGAWDSYPNQTNGPLWAGAGGFGFDYCPDNNKFYGYNGSGDQVIHVLTPPSPLANARDVGANNWKTGTWTWTSETNTGEPLVDINSVISTQGGQPFSKWKYHKGLKAFMWSQGKATGASPDGVTRDGAFQLYRPVGITG